jgi:hypothetical protein
MNDVGPATPRLVDQLQLPDRPQPEVTTQELPSLEPSPNKPAESPAGLPQNRIDQDEVMDLEAPQVSETEPGPPETTSSTFLVPPQDRTPADIPAVIPSSPPALPTSPPTTLQPTSSPPVANEPTPPIVMADFPMMPPEYVDSDRKATSQPPTPAASPPPPIKSEIIQDETMPASEALSEEPEPVNREDIIPDSPASSARTASTGVVEAPLASCRNKDTPRKESIIPASRPKRKHNPEGVFARRQFLPWPFHVLNEDEHKSAVLLIEVSIMGRGQLHFLMYSILEDVSPHLIEL